MRELTQIVIHDLELEEYRQQAKKEGQTALALFRLLNLDSNTDPGTDLEELLRNHLGPHLALEISARLQDAWENYIEVHSEEARKLGIYTD